MTQPAQDKEFLQDLRNENPKLRRQTAQSLASWDDRRAFGLLNSLLADADPSVRSAAVQALGRWAQFHGQTAEAFELLAATCTDRDPRVRGAGVSALGMLKDRRAFELLEAALSDARHTVRGFAASALGELRDPRAVQPLLRALRDSDSFVQNQANEALVALGDPEPEPRLLTAVLSKDPELRLTASLELLYRSDPGTVGPLTAFPIQSWSEVIDSFHDWIAVVKGLSKLRHPGAVTALLDAIADDDFDIKAAANQALIELGDPQPFERLSRVIEFLHIEEEAAMGGVYQRGNPSSQDAKRWIAEDRQLRLQAIDALRKLGDPRATRPLFQVLDFGDEEMRTIANHALIDLGDPEPYDRLARLIQYPRSQLGRSAFTQLAARGGVQAIEILSQALTSNDYEIQLHAASALITLSDAPKFDALLILLYDGETWQRKKAAEALGTLGDLRAVRHLLDRLCDPDREVRDTASRALMDLGDPEPEEHRSVRREQQHDYAIEVLEDWKWSGELESIHAVRTLFELGDPDAASVLERVMHREPSDGLAYEVISALGKLGDPSTIHILMAPMVDEDAWPGLRDAAKRAVIDIVNKEREGGLDALLSELECGEPRQIAAVRLLGELGDESVVDALIELTQEEDNIIRAEAEKALQPLESRGISVGSKDNQT